MSLRLAGLSLVMFVSGAWCSAALAAPPAPPSEVIAQDHPNDRGDKVALAWQLSPDDRPDVNPRTVFKYRIQRSSVPEAGWVTLGEVEYGTSSYVDAAARTGEAYFYRVAAVGQKPEDLSANVATETAVAAEMQWFDWHRAWFLVLLALISSAVIGFILLARAGYPMRVRRIAGLEVVDEAVGRATEMGRSCLFVPGIQDLTEIETVAGVTVLSRVAKTAAEYDATVEVPTARSLVMTAARETMQASFLAAGRPDAYNENRVYYVTDEQFGYVAHLTGLMVRDKPAACFYMGSFYAESLMLAEVGNSIGAIQIAGTAQPAQLPFFVAACDYTLIGEEFFAASAYLSGEPNQLGSLKGQDCGKVIVAALLLVGCLLATWVGLREEANQPPRDGRPEKALSFLMNEILMGGDR